MADPTRGVREQFLVEVTDSSPEQLAEQGLSQAAALLDLNALFTAWVESVYHHRVHSETGQAPLQRWDDGWQAAGHGPVMASADALTEAFLWSQWRVVAKTATVSLHGNTYQVEPALAGRKVELVFSPFNLEVITVRYQDADYGRAVPHRITRHAHPKARPETPEPAPAPATGIAYLQLVADAHHQQIAAEERIGFHALYSTRQTPPPDSPPPDNKAPQDKAPQDKAPQDKAPQDKAPQDGQLAGQLSIDEAVNEAMNDAVTKHDVTEQDTQARA